MKKQNLNFGEAIRALKQGLRVAREGWNGKDMFLYHVPENKYPPVTEIAKKAFSGEDVPYGAYIAMKTAQNNVVPWLASQTDVLADDWCVLDEGFITQEEDKVNFGLYLLSDERRNNILSNTSPSVSNEERLKQVYHADFENYTHYKN